MTKNIIANGILKSILIITSILIGLYLLNEIKILISYIIIAVIVSLIGRPIVKFLMNKLKFKNSSASILTMIMLIGLIVGIISLFIPLIIEQGKNLSLLDVDSFQENIKYLYIEMSNYLNQFNIGILSVMFISFFFLKDSQMLQKILFILLPKKSSVKIKNSYDKIKLLLSRYFTGLILQIFILFIIYTIILLIIGTPNAVVIAFLCSLLNLIPFIGPFIGGILMVLLTMSSHISEDFSSVILPKATYVAIGFTFGQLIDNFLSQPFIFSNSVKSHPLEIFLVIIIAGLLFGPIGMIAAVPTYTALKVIGKEFLSENRIIKELTKNL
jgi:predicted PurR-regulated permease PerM